jgi:hypothetical protein
MNEVARRRQEIMSRKRERERQRQEAEREQSKRMVELDDVLTLVLQKWSLAQLLHYMAQYVVRVLQHRDDFEECRFADDTLLECGEAHDPPEVSFAQYCALVCQSAERDAGVVAAHDHYVMALRACFLLALVYDTRVRQFVMGRHHINYALLHCRPPGRLKTNAYVEAVLPALDAFLERRIPLAHAYEQCMQLWHSEQFTLRRYVQDPYLYGCDGAEPENIPHSYHPQTRSTESRTDCGPLLVDELGY